MKQKKYVKSLTILVSDEMYAKVKAHTEEKKIGISDFIRSLIEDYLEDLIAYSINSWRSHNDK